MPKTQIRPDSFFIMPIPQTSSVEAFERHFGDKCLRTGRGEAWLEINA
jgi:hypothetical protein